MVTRAEHLMNSRKGGLFLLLIGLGFLFYSRFIAFKLMIGIFSAISFILAPIGIVFGIAHLIDPKNQSKRIDIIIIFSIGILGIINVLTVFFV